MLFGDSLVTVVAVAGLILAYAILTAVDSAQVVVIAGLGRKSTLALLALALVAGVLGIDALLIRLAASLDRLELTLASG